MTKCLVCQKEHPQDMTGCSRLGGCENLITNERTGARTWACKLAVQYRTCAEYCKVDRYIALEQAKLDDLKSRCARW